MNKYMQDKKNQEKNLEECIKVEDNEKSKSSKFTFKDFEKIANEKRELKSFPSYPSSQKLESGFSLNSPNLFSNIESRNSIYDKETVSPSPINDNSSNNENNKKEETMPIPDSLNLANDFNPIFDDSYNEKIKENEIEKEKEIDCNYGCDCNCNVIEFELIPYIFTERFNNNEIYCNHFTFSRYSFIDITTYNIFYEDTIKSIASILDQRLRFVYKLRSLEMYPKFEFNEKYFVVKCRVIINNDELVRFIESEEMENVNKKFEKYMINIKDFKIYTSEQKYFYNFKYVKDYLNIYIRSIFGYSAHKINYSCDLQKEIPNALNHKSINPFTYFKNTIPIKKYIMINNKDTYTNIIKVGFVFNGDIKQIDKN